MSKISQVPPFVSLLGPTKLQKCSLKTIFRIAQRLFQLSVVLQNICRESLD